MQFLHYGTLFGVLLFMFAFSVDIIVANAEEFVVEISDGISTGDSEPKTNFYQEESLFSNSSWKSYWIN